MNFNHWLTGSYGSVSRSSKASYFLFFFWQLYFQTFDLCSHVNPSLSPSHTHNLKKRATGKKQTGFWIYHSLLAAMLTRCLAELTGLNIVFFSSGQWCATMKTWWIVKDTSPKLNPSACCDMLSSLFVALAAQPELMALNMFLKTLHSIKY